ncbi:SDR family oxidoreductase [Streptomyces alanosinicus]|uniref:Ketoreductase n=1 Tax=Streptomyces alanosinicus TaxID=68171 RepID=A0A918YST1_9ACTN|nr:SDR family oxidoreductase [Streptomyces alanosinicus]GHE15484.1 ketoreductase [Streptomyces alanosinicus]
MNQRKTVLLTGASGVLGSALLPLLTRHRVIALVHSTDVPAEQVRGDLAAARLGLDDATYRWLTDIVDTVVHCGATTDFGAGAEATAELNTRGTQRVVEFARQAGAELLYVSTAFVARTDLTRHVAGRAQGEATAVPDHYLDSKRAAEELVRACGLPYTIARPSVIIGDRQTGFVPRFQGLHSIVTALLKGSVPLLPLDPSARADVIPRDDAARALAALLERPFSGAEHWLTTGAAAPTASEVVGACRARAAAHGMAMPTPRLVDPDMVDRLVRPVFIDPLPPAARRRFDDMLAMTALFATAAPLPCTLGSLAGGPGALTAEQVRSAVDASIDHLIQVRNLARSRAPEGAAA